MDPFMKCHLKRHIDITRYITLPKCKTSLDTPASIKQMPNSILPNSAATNSEASVLLRCAKETKDKDKLSLAFIPPVPLNVNAAKSGGHESRS